MSEDELNWGDILGQVAFEEFLAYLSRYPVTDWNEYLPGCANSPLMEALLGEREDSRIIRYLIEHGADVNSGDPEDGISPIHFAALHNSPECLSYLLSVGADVNQPNFSDEPYRPIHHAAWNSNLDMIKVLVEHGADVNCQNEYGDTPFSIALHNDNFDIADYLRAHGACI